jgi:hypothetical protein
MHVSEQPRLQRFTLYGFAVLISVLQLFYLFQYLKSPFASFPCLDAAVYDRWAQSVLKNGLLREAPYHVAPLYAYFLALVYQIFGRSFIALAFLQFGLFLTNGVLLARLTHRIGGPALLSLLLYGFSAPFLFYAVRPETATLGLTFILVGLEFLLASRIFAGGLFLGFSALVRPEMILFVPLAAYWAYRINRRNAFVLVLAFVIAVLPATLHNFISNGRFLAISSSGGEVFYQGNARKATGIISRLPGSSGNPMVQESESREVAWKATGRRLEPDEVQNYWFRRTFTEILQSPGHWFTILARKVRFLVSGRDIPLSYSIDVETWETTPILKLFFVTTPLLISMAFLVPANRFNSQPALLLCLFLAAQVFALLLFFVATRLKLPFQAVLIPFAATGLAAIPETWRRHRRRLIAAAALFCAVTFTDRMLVIPNMNSYNELARAYLAGGKREEAVRAIRKAVSESPARAELWLQLGMILDQTGYPGVEEAFTKALSLEPKNSTAWNLLGLYRKKRGDELNAIASFKQAVLLQPNDWRAKFNLAQILARKGNKVEALELLESGLSIHPHREMHLLAAKVATDIGDPLRAQRHVEASRRTGPE